jgi:hypothetical protein
MVLGLLGLAHTVSAQNVSPGCLTVDRTQIRIVASGAGCQPSELAVAVRWPAPSSQIPEALPKRPDSTGEAMVRFFAGQPAAADVAVPVQRADAVTAVPVTPLLAGVGVRLPTLAASPWSSR